MIEKQYSDTQFNLSYQIKDKITIVSTGAPKPLPSYSCEDSFSCLKDKNVSGFPNREANMKQSFENTMLV